MLLIGFALLSLLSVINWGLIGFFDYNLVEAIFGGPGARVIYAIVGLCALYTAIVSPNLGRKAVVRPHRAAQQPI
jgi:uncharacterized membrane protein YuzA (DUF378 family)